MTTNQTIDGVPLLPCPFCGKKEDEFHLYTRRIALDVFHCVRCYCGAETHDYTAEGAARQWNSRVPAAQPRGEPVACDHEWTDDGEFLLVCTACGAQEDYRQALQLAFELGGTDDGNYDLDADELCEVLRLYAEQPAPVAMVLPRKLIDSTGTLNQKGLGFMEGYNTCLDEWERLNPSL